ALRLNLRRPRLLARWFRLHARLRSVGCARAAFGRRARAIFRLAIAGLTLATRELPQALLVSLTRSRSRRTLVRSFALGARRLGLLCACCSSAAGFFPLALSAGGKNAAGDPERDDPDGTPHGD